LGSGLIDYPGSASLTAADRGRARVDSRQVMAQGSSVAARALVDGGDLPLRLGPARVNLENDGSSWREDPPEQAHQRVAIRSTPNVQLVTVDEIKLELGTACPIKRELKLMAPRSGYYGYRLAVSNPCHAAVVDQNSIRASGPQPSPGRPLDRDPSA
jgi:hypothetical protein